MKAKFAALALALGMGVTGIAATAQAAGTEAGRACAHEHCSFTSSETQRDYYDRQRHILITVEVYHCRDCNEDVSKTMISGYEDHDYEQIYLEDGRGMSYCTGCNDYYYF